MKHRGLLKHCALLFIFIHWRTACCAPTQSSCTKLDSLKRGTVIMEDEAKKLLDTYLSTHLGKDYVGQFRNNVPDSTITGVTLREKLQSIFSKNELFKFHLEQLEKYDVEYWNSAMLSSLSQMKETVLWNHQTLLIQMDPDASLQSPTTAPPIPTYSDGFKIKEYSWEVLYSLNEWSKAVKQALEETDLCHSF